MCTCSEKVASIDIVIRLAEEAVNICRSLIIMSLIELITTKYVEVIEETRISLDLLCEMIHMSSKRKCISTKKLDKSSL